MGLRAFDLFCGIGGFRAGIEISDFKDQIEFVALCDNDKYAIEGYKSMYKIGDEKLINDIQVITRNGKDRNETTNTGSSQDSIIGSEIPDFDLLLAGFPCQPHSLMGNRKGYNDERGDLFYDIKEIIRVKKPAYFILENVRAIRSVNEGALYEYIVNSLQNDLGYNLRVWTLNASDYGVPQTRRRIFFVGSIKELPEQPPKKVALGSEEYPSLWHLLEKEVDDRYFLSEKILKTILKNEHKGYKRPAVINKMIARPVCKTMHKLHRASQDNYVSEDFINGYYNKFDNSVNLNPNFGNRIRRITPKEAMRIQSFPEENINKLLNAGLSDTRIYMLAGNAVPPKMIKAIINEIVKI